jgi:hypothetical protein
MKGTSWAEIRRVLREADDDFYRAKIVGGLSSAEGLIVHIRDPSGDPDAEDFDEGVPDKRLLIVESEFASVLAQGKREGNTLLPRLREAWDGSTLRTMTIRPRIASDPHVVIIGHITPTELRKRLSETERAGGTANRFLPVMSRRSKRLPDGGDLNPATIKGLGTKLAERIAEAKQLKRMKRTVEAAKYWRDLYERLTSDHAGDGPVAQVIARAAPQVLRLSVTTALLDSGSSPRTTSVSLRRCGPTPRTRLGTCSAAAPGTRIWTGCGCSWTRPETRASRGPTSASSASAATGRGRSWTR